MALKATFPWSLIFSARFTGSSSSCSGSGEGEGEGGGRGTGDSKREVEVDLLRPPQLKTVKTVIIRQYIPSSSIAVGN